MKFADPYILKVKEPTSTILFAASQLQGDRPAQEDYFANFNDECFVIADGVGGMHGDVAAKLACETAIWTYKHVRLRPGYWKDKKLFTHRIFRTTNITLWQKHRERQFSQGLAATLVTAIIGVRTLWLGSVGDSRAYMLSKGSFSLLTHDDVDEVGHLTKVMGVMRYGLKAQLATREFLTGDSLLLVTDGVVNFLETKDIHHILKQSGSSSQALQECVVELLHMAKKVGSTDNMTACIIKRVATNS